VLKKALFTIISLTTPTQRIMFDFQLQSQQPTYSLPESLSCRNSS